MPTMKEGVAITDVGTLEIESIFMKEMLQAQTVDVQDIDYYRKQDVDFLMFLNGKRFKVEIKVDTVGHTTGNIFCETISNMNKGTEGCFMYTKCDYWMYYMLHTKTLYVFAMNSFREWVLSQKDGVWKKRNGFTELWNGDFYKSEGYIVPIDEILSKAPHCVKVFDLEQQVQVH